MTGTVKREAFADMYANDIHRIYNECLLDHPFTDEKAIVRASGNIIIFSKQALNENKDDIVKFLKLLPEEYHTPEGSATMIKFEMELLQMGEAIGKVKCCENKDIKSILPIGMPIYTIIEEGQNEGLLSENTCKRQK